MGAASSSIKLPVSRFDGAKSGSIVTKGTAERAISLHRAAVRREANGGYILL
jgi:hypothetical protein